MKNLETREQQDEARNGDNNVRAPGVGAGVPCYQTLVEHWAKARIDGPVQAVARYDDAAKQLITIGGFLQAGIIAAYAALGERPGFSMTGWQVGVLVAFEATLLFFVSASAWVCNLQPELKVKPVSKLLSELIKCPDKDKIINEAMCQWCGEFTESVERKQRWMLAAKISFVACCLTIALLLLLQLSA